MDMAFWGPDSEDPFLQTNSILKAVGLFLACCLHVWLPIPASLARGRENIWPSGARQLIALHC